jgi:Right handed beta helix region
VSLGRSCCRAGQICIFFCCAWSGLAQISQEPSSGSARHPTTYFVDCASKSLGGDGSQHSPLSTLAQVNALSLQAGDSVLFKRGSTCKGELQPRGSGVDGAPIRIGAYADGPLPHIETAPSDQAALRLFNQSFWEISSLDLAGGTTYGFFAGGDQATLHHLYLRDVSVHDVRGPLKCKESGLVVISMPGEHGNFDDVQLDGVAAYNTTQWAGIFVSGASHVRVRNSTVHDVQGDGIVVFRAKDAVITRSLAWHTGMQHQLTIGTPNAIWTWNCTDCTVEDNEAFLTDSPGVDGGSFDIDTGNIRNTVQRNFGHDTAGYCVSIFGALVPTTDSLVADNLCLNNGMSPRLAQRQGAILLMTWQGGTLNGAAIRGNRIYWNSSGDAPAVQSGGNLQATGVTLRANEISSTGLALVDPMLRYTGDHNHYALSNDADREAAMPAFVALHETSSTLTVDTRESSHKGHFGFAATNTNGWRLELSVPAWMLDEGKDDELRATLIQLKSAALQFGHCGLKVTIRGDTSMATLVKDWSLQADGIALDTRPTNDVSRFSIKLISPNRNVIRGWNVCPSPVDLGFALRQNVGPPDFSRLPFEQVRATD